MQTSCQDPPTLGAKVLILRPGDPEAKGITERAYDYLETSFRPARTSAGPGDFERPAAGLAGSSEPTHPACHGLRADRSNRPDKAAMQPLPPVAPATGWRASRRLPRDFYVRLDGNDYSVHPQVIGRRIENWTHEEFLVALAAAGGLTHG